MRLREPEPRAGLADRITWLIVAVTVAGLPLAVHPSGKDAFRLPKDLLLQSSGILLATVAVCARILGAPVRPSNRWSRMLVVVLGAILFWSTLVTLLSTNRILSLFSLLTLAAAAMLFVAFYNSIESRPLSVLYVALAPSIINACIAVAQRTGIWIPFGMGTETSRLRTVGLFGNANDLAMFLVPSSLAAIALAMSSPRHRASGIVIAAILLTALAASETIGAVGAVAAGILVLLYRFRPRYAWIAVLLALPLASGVIAVSGRLPNVRAKLSSAARGDYDPLLSGRIPGFVTAWRMFRANPITGVGLGCFRFHYFDQKISAAAEDPAVRTTMVSHPENFGQAHNEHLQILAEGGLPGYALFIAALSVIARISFRQTPASADERSVFSRTLAVPLAAAIFVLTLTAFPFRLASPTLNGLFFCAATLVWGERADH